MSRRDLGPEIPAADRFPQRSTKRMPRSRKARLRGAAMRKLFLINVVLYGLAILAAVSGSPSALLLPAVMTVMFVVWVGSEYLGDAWEDGMVAAARTEFQDRASQRAQRRELRRKGQDPVKTAKRLERGDAVRIGNDGEIVFEDRARHDSRSQ